MKRDYADGVTDSAELFIGTEIEKTPAYGMKTLFVVGIKIDNFFSCHGKIIASLIVR